MFEAIGFIGIMVAFMARPLVTKWLNQKEKGLETALAEDDFKSQKKVKKLHEEVVDYVEDNGQFVKVSAITKILNGKAPSVRPAKKV